MWPVCCFSLKKYIYIYVCVCVCVYVCVILFAVCDDIIEELVK